MSSDLTNIDRTSSADAKDCFQKRGSVGTQYPDLSIPPLFDVIRKSSSSISSFLVCTSEDLIVCGAVIDCGRLFCISASKRPQLASVIL
jgi:hypothetical protein